MKNLRIESAIVAVGLIVAGLLVYCGFSSVAEKDRSVQVRGFNERIVNADKATWPINAKLRGDNLAALYASAKTSTQTIRQFLIKNGIPAKDITESAPSVTDYSMQDWKPENISSRYTLDLSITVSTKKVMLVHDLTYRVSELMTQGIYITTNGYGGNVNYEFTGLDKIKPAMIEASTQNAREAAEQFAKNSDSKLGKIKNATQGYFSIEDRDAQTPWVKKVRVVTTVEYYLKN